jgi:hypothetical protein
VGLSSGGAAALSAPSDSKLVLRTRGLITGWGGLHVSKRNVAFILGDVQAAVWSPKTRVLRRYSMRACLRERTSDWWIALSTSSLYWECDYQGAGPSLARLYGVVLGRGRPFRLGRSSQSYSLAGDGRDAIILHGEKLWRLVGNRKVGLRPRVGGGAGGEILSVAAGRILVRRYSDGATFVQSLNGTLRQEVPDGGDLTACCVVSLIWKDNQPSLSVYDISAKSIVHEWPLPFAPSDNHCCDDFDIGNEFAAFVPVRGSPNRYGIYVLRLATGDVSFIPVPTRVDVLRIGRGGVYYARNVRGRGELYFLSLAKLHLASLPPSG